MSRRYKPLSINDHSDDILSHDIQPHPCDSSTQEDAKVRHWKHSLYAAGLVEPTWTDELNHRKNSGDKDKNRVDEDHYDENGVICDCACVHLSALVCSILGAKRIGNMVVLKDRWVVDHYKDGENISEEDDDSHDSDIMLHDDQEGQDDDGDDAATQLKEDDNARTRRMRTSPNRNVSMTRKQQGSVQKRHVLDLVVGPFWPFLFCVTYPLVLGVSSLTAYFAIFIPGQNPYIVLVWSILTVGLCFSLFSVSCRDPGIMLRHHEPPANISLSDTTWRWNEESLSFRPRDAFYDSECAVVIEEFDHTCPWTGTAIGKKNMMAFQCFVGLICICLIMDVLLLTVTTTSTSITNNSNSS